MTPAVQLLLACARLDMSAQQREAALRRIRTGLDWDELADLAARHGLVPLLFRNLEAFAAEAIPKATFASFWSRCEATARRNHAMAAELGALLAAFAAEGIQAVAYKGPALALFAYGDLALREFGDLDILLRPRDVARAKALLQARGYAPAFDLPPVLEAALVHSTRHYEMPFVDPTRAILVELHWRTDPDFQVMDLEAAEWWTALPTLKLGEAQIRTLPAEELTLILCLHGSKHFWASLGWLVDIAELIRHRPGLEWAGIVARSRSLGCTRKLALALILARDLLQVELPAEAGDIVRDAAAREMAAHLLPGLWERDYRAPSIPRALHRNLRLQDTRARAARHLLKALFTPGLGEWQRWSLPRGLFLMYWPLRWVRLAEKYLLRREPSAPEGYGGNKPAVLRVDG